MKENHILYKLFLIAVLGVLPMMGWADDVFKHYQGIANKEGDYEVIDASEGCLRQKTHEYHYYVPVQSGGSVSLKLPIVNFTSDTGGDPLEPRGFFRWYNYDTDYQSENTKPYDTTNTHLQEMVDEYKQNKGWIAYSISDNAVQRNVGVLYTRPSDANWKGETIACDVSRYVDGIENKTFSHEPTLSMRYIFHVIPAEQRADAITEALRLGLESKANDLTYEDNKEISVGLKATSSTMNIRLNANDPSLYYFHPMANVNTHHVFYNDEQYKIQASDLTNTSLLQATQIMWKIYDSTKSKCCWYRYNTSDTNCRFFEISLNKLNGIGYSAWHKLNGAALTSAADKPNFTYGDRVYIVVLAVNGNNMCPIANFTVSFNSHYPMTQEQLQNASENTRLINYLDEHYRSVATVSFDDDDDEMTLVKPTSPTNNQDQLPSKWSKRSYGFVYPTLLGKTASGSTNDKWSDPKHSPIHGEYGLYKTANVRGVSGSGSSFTDQYLWYQSGTLYDRTYESTNGAQYGHFLYIDAADESRQIAEADFKASLCVGSQVIFSSAIADMTTNIGVKPEVMFKLYGVHYDENNKETDRKLLHSFSTGYLSGNVDDYATCKWYQSYGKMVLQKESGVGNYEDFKIVVDNLCKGTKGADYAFDDLRIYTQASKVDVIQSAPICPSVDINQGYNAATMGNIKMKIRAMQETMSALADHTEKKLYFRFVDVATGKPTTDVNYATSGVPDYKWGSTTIYTEVDNGEQVDGAAMYEKLNDDWYVVLANRNFNLNPTKKYYLSFAFDDEAVEDKNNLSWGKPSDVCSLYSDEFNLVQQTVVITDANGSITTAVTIPCDDKETPEYNIKAQLQTVDQNNGGTINLQSIKFNWYVDDTHSEPVLKNSTDFKGVKLSEGEHTIYVEPVNTSTTVTEGGVNYEICLGMMSFKLRAVKNGPKLNFGFSDVVYPDSYERTVRVGLPQVKELVQQGAGKGYIKIPVRDKNFIVDGSQNLQFVETADQDNPVSTTAVYLSDTNDPLYANRSDMTGLKLGELESAALARNVQTLNFKFMPQKDSQLSDDGTVQLHEGYWYEGALIFNEDGKDNTKVLCSGEAFIRFEIVPEFLTWYPTAKKQMSAAWNNDQNWVRSTRSELYKKDTDYVDYVGGIASDAENDLNELDIPRQNAYVPMKFTKVTIPNLSGLYYPDLGYIAYRQSNQIATKLSNAKGDEATQNIQYAIMVCWDANAASHGLSNGNLACEKFYGNTCDQIYFKPGGEILDQCFLIYNKAWVEKEMKLNTWYAMTSPLKNVYAGDMYVPKKNGRQETEAFQDISFSDTDNSRVNYPFYQRSWDKSDVTEVTSSGTQGAYDYAGTGIAFDSQNLKTVTANWSHIYNKVDKGYDIFEGFALKAGDDYATSTQTEKALVRLPKEDTKYSYYAANTSGSLLASNVLDKTNNYRLTVEPSFTEGSLSEMTMNLPILSSGNSYYLVGNPYMSTLSMYYFLRANTALSPNVYVYEDGALKQYSVNTSASYTAKEDVKISPMQSFFVKLKDGESVKELKFTSNMTIDREVVVNTQSQALDSAPASFSMTVTDGHYSSCAKVVVSDEASLDYQSLEDMELLYDSNLKNVPTIYTVASNQTVSVNAVPEVVWMPMGIIADKKGDVTVSWDGISSLGEPLYLYDAAEKQYQELQEGGHVTVKSNEHGRYFLTTTRGTTDIDNVKETSEIVKCYSPTNGLVVVSASTSNLLRQVAVYTTDGRLVKNVKCEGEMSVHIQLPSALYIIKATVSSSTQPVVKKITVN